MNFDIRYLFGFEKVISDNPPKPERHSDALRAEIDT